MSTAYDERFFEWVNLTARHSAQTLLTLVKEQVRPASVLDVGCGQGAWLAVWLQLGVEGYGLDGSHVNKEALLIPRERFQAVDLRKPWSIGRRFDLVQSLEVAEHLPAASAETFVQCLCAHGDVVLFSAARPGQGGEGHINERKPSYWAELFERQGFAAFDCIRPRVANEDAIAPWYRFNTVLYANTMGASRLDPVTGRSRIENPADLDRGGDWLWHLRCTLLGLLPEPTVAFLSRLRYRLVVAYAERNRNQ